MIKLCQETDLPLMREQYSFKLTFRQLKEIDQCVIDAASFICRRYGELGKGLLN